MKSSIILITGAHRSGTTWVGKVLSRSRRSRYLHEPFNLHSKGFVPTNHWYTYVCADNEDDWLQQVETHLGAAFHPLNRLRAIKSVPLKLQLETTLDVLYNQLPGFRVIVKDPIAFFSSEWLAERFGMQVVLTIRHPAAFAGSLKQREWSFPFEHLLEQPLLMRDYLSDHAEEIEKFARHRQDVVDQAALLWTLIYSTARKLAASHRGWIVVRHEDLSRRPFEEFRSLTERLCIPFTRGMRSYLGRTTAATNPVETEKPHVLARNSKENIWLWRERLTSGEVTLVRERTEEVASHWYGREDWLI